MIPSAADEVEDRTEEGADRRFCVFGYNEKRC